ncbi:MAG: hypothetical protein ACE14P_15715 [Methanotrichaceae archaeon]
MPSNRYTRIEITPDAYRALEAEAILQRKTLKKLASELIMSGVSKKALDFIQEVSVPRETNVDLSDPKIAKVIDKIGATAIHIDENLLETIQEMLLKEGYPGAMLYAAQHTASAERDELHRVLTICERYKVPPTVAAEIIGELNTIKHR